MRISGFFYCFCGKLHIAFLSNFVSKCSCGRDLREVQKLANIIEGK